MLIRLLVLLGIAAVLLARRSRRRPTAAELMAMSDADFQAFVEKIGLGTRSRPAPNSGHWTPWAEPFGDL